MKDSTKANLIVFFIIAIISFAMGNAIASLTVNEENDSYKLLAIENNSFEPHYINAVPTYIPPEPENNTTYNNTGYDYSDNGNGSYGDGITTYTEY